MNPRTTARMRLRSLAADSQVLLLRSGFVLLGRVAPAAAARWAESLFFTPPKRRRRASRPLAAPSRRLKVEAAGAQVSVSTWGQGPAVALFHGWGGDSGQLSAFVAPLVERGFTAVALDAPGHGASSGRRSSLPEFAAALAATGAALGPIHGVIAHSLGAAATALALRRGLSLGRAVFLGPPRDPIDWTREFAARLGIAPHVLAALQANSERRLGFRWEELDVPAAARSLRVPLLVFHDRGDREVPWSDGHAIATAWAGARLETTRGLGHQRILRDPAVVEHAVAFVAGDTEPARPAAWLAPCPTPGCLRPAAECGLCLACGFERELYQREDRSLRAAV